MRKYESKQVDSHEVYCVMDENSKIIYIGSGRNNRHKHCESGCSHVYELNRMHFNGDKVNIKLLHINLTKEESIEIEQALILLHKPRLNRQFTSSDVRKASMYEGKLLKEKLLKIIIGLGTRSQILLRFHNQVLDFIDTYKVQGLIKGVRVKHRIVEPLRGKDKTSDRLRYFNYIFKYEEGILRLTDTVIERLNAKED